MKCLNCGTEFEPKRKTAKFCSSKCRVYASRGLTFNDRIIMPTEAQARELAAISSHTPIVTNKQFINALGNLIRVATLDIYNVRKEYKATIQKLDKFNKENVQHG